MSELSTTLIHHPYTPPDGFKAISPPVHKASTILFPSMAALRSRATRIRCQGDLHLGKALEPGRARMRLDSAGAPLQPAKRPSATASASAAESIFFMFFITPFPLPDLPGHSRAHKFIQRACGLCPILL